MTNTFTPPKVWTWDAENGGEWAKLNRPIAGATHDKDLPKGDHALQLYSMATPNGVKVTVMLEELLAAGHKAEYDAWIIKIGDGDQFGSGFVDLNPNSKIPALMDHDTGSRVFESGAILLYLAEKYGAFLPASGPERTEVLNWLFWLQGSAPYLGGGFGHFFAYAPEKFEYPINRFTMETKRQLDVLDKRLGESKYLGGDNYSIADIATAPWYGRAIQDKGYPGAGDFLAVHEYANIIRWMDDISARSAYVRGAIVNKAWGENEPQLPNRHSAADIDAALES